MSRVEGLDLAACGYGNDLVDTRQARRLTADVNAGRKGNSVLPHVILLPDASRSMLPPNALFSAVFRFICRKAEGQSDALGGRRTEHGLLIMLRRLQRQIHLAPHCRSRQ